MVKGILADNDVRGQVEYLVALMHGQPPTAATPSPRPALADASNAARTRNPRRACQGGGHPTPGPRETAGRSAATAGVPTSRPAGGPDRWPPACVAGRAW
jgi:hypothetical protein